MTQPEQLRQAFEKLARIMPEKFNSEDGSCYAASQDATEWMYMATTNTPIEDIHYWFSLLGVSVWIVPQDSITDDEQEQICSLEAQFYTINNHRFIDSYEIDVRPPFDYHEALLEAFCKYVEQLPEEVKK